MITLEEISSRIIDKKDYDFSVNKGSWEPKRAEDYILPKLTIIESAAPGAKGKLKNKLSKVLAFIDSVKHKRLMGITYR